MKTTVIAEMVQYPVGQGGFFCGTLNRGSGTKDFRWVYDCGSDRSCKDELEREINKIPSQYKIDTLYISHFDEDHVSGVEHLVNRCGVKKFVIPHLNQYEKVHTLLHYFETTEARSDFIRELVIDPEGVRSRYQIDQVIRVGSGSYRPIDEEGEDPDDLPPEGSGVDEVLTDVWSPELEPDPEYPTTSSAGSKEGTYVARGNVTSSVCIREVRFDWEFVPYVYPMPEDEYEQFKEKVDEILDKDPDDELDDSLIRELIENSENMNKLSNLYKDTSLGPNPLSMSLYIGPRLVCNGAVYPNASFVIDLYSKNHSFGCCRDYYCYTKIGNSKNPRRQKGNIIRPPGGWILTGDSKFQRNDHFRRFKNRYQKYRSSMDVVMVPHHGSKYNVEQDFFEFFDPFFMTYVAAGPDNTHGHPTPQVASMACASAPFHIVGTDPFSELTLRNEWRFW